MSSPVTVSITRHVDPAHTDEMIAWIRAGGALAVRFEGFLGTGWVRPGPGSDRWHMLYRFADDESLQRWEVSDLRLWWLGAAQGIVGESNRERRTGIEGWFDEPAHTDVQGAGCRAHAVTSSTAELTRATSCDHGSRARSSEPRSR